jgi:hypothetical protein
MTTAEPARVLLITDHVIPATELLDAIRARAARGPAQFRVLMPNPARAEWNPLHPERHKKVAEAELALQSALALIEAAAGDAVRGVVSTRHDPMDAIEEALRLEPCDEIILAIAPHDIERRLHIDLPHRLAHLGLPLTTIAAERVAAPA